MAAARDEKLRARLARGFMRSAPRQQGLSAESTRIKNGVRGRSRLYDALNIQPNRHGDRERACVIDRDRRRVAAYGDAMLGAMPAPIGATSSAVVKVRVLTNRAPAGLASTRGLTLPTGVLNRLGWDAGDAILMRVTRSGRLVVERVESYD